MNFKRTFLFLGCLLLLTHISFGQLAPFTFQVAATHETCTGNGALTFAATGTTSGASIFYSVYLLPDTVNPIAVVNTTTVTGLSAGNYQIVALQTFGALSNSQQQDVVIQDNRVPLIYQCVAQSLNCLIGQITVNVAQGNPVSYEIVSGEVTAPPQTSNVFTNLPLGNYVVKVTDACGDSVVQACTLVFIFEPTNLIISSLSQECSLIDCHTKQIQIFVFTPHDSFGLPLPGVIIPYPFELETTVFPPGGGTPIVTTQSVTSGGTLSQSIGINIPYYEVPIYLVNFRIIDPCGNVLATWNGVEISGTKKLFLGRQGAKECYKKIKIDYCNLLPPFNVAFLSAPPGFNPSTFNPGNLGPFNGPIEYVSDAQHEIPDGTYVIQVTDACGTVLQDQLTVKNSKTDISYPDRGFYKGCDYQFPVTIGFDELHPITVIVTGAPVDFDHILPYDASSFIDEDGLFFIRNFPIPGHYVIDGVNVCGFPFHFEFDVPPPNIEPFFDAGSSFGCAHNAGTISFGIAYGPPLVSVIITEAPELFNHTLPYDASSYISVSINFPYLNENFGQQQFLPDGGYTIVMTDACGTQYGPFSAKVPVRLNLDPPTISVLEGCEIGFGSVRLSLPFDTNTSFETVVITAAPPAYIQALPYDVSFNIDNPYGSFYMNSLPQGTYTFYTKDSCGVEHTFEVVIGNHYFDTTADVEGNCGSFNLFIHNSGIPTEGTVYFVLQKFNPITQQWMHPITNFPFLPGIYPNGVNSYLLGLSNYNITSQGTFRILKLSFIYSNGNSNLISCITVLKEFDFLGALKINGAYKISCLSGSSQVLITAGDTSPLTYKITTKNGQPFLVDNGNSNIFNGLLPGIYNFQVQDGCGNIVNRLFDVSTLSEPVVTASNLCEGQVGQLSVLPFSFLSYQWWKADDPATILSTNNVLPITPFTLPGSLGTYYVRVYSQSVLSCIDTIISFVIPQPTAPNAGDDTALMLCSVNPLNLDTTLMGVHDANGIWSEVTNSGMLNGNVWLPIGLLPGIYTFKYTVNGFCGVFDQSLLTITLHDDLPNPTVNAGTEFCTGDLIAFEVDPIPNATFQWTGPDNFSSTNQNPSISSAVLANSGDYIVKAIVGDCESSTVVPIVIHAAPEFTFKTACNDGNFTLFVVPINTSFDTDAVNYYWTGPENFNTTEPSIILNDLAPGNYSVSITTPEGCITAKVIPVQNTKCAIPAGISPNTDNYNESFDLTGFDVLNLKIYSRYGNIVYEKNNYTNQWHGQDFKGRELPDATYYYYIRFGNGKEKTGWVYVTK